MKPTTKYTQTCIRVKIKNSGDSLEETVRKAIATNQPIEGNAPMIYTPAKDGVIPAYDPRTDKQMLALDAMDKFQGTDAMKGFIAQTEYGEDGTDGKGNTRPQEEVKKEEQ